jgi:hypothetical protein
MKRTILACAAIAGAAMLAPSARAAEPAGARSFLVKLYAHYPQRRGAPAFDPAGRSAAAVLDPPLVALIRDNVRLTPKGDAPALDGDPICDCQDDQGMSVRIGPIRATGGSTASAPVAIKFAAADPPAASHLDLDLVLAGGQWRVHDVHSKDLPSLRAYLIQSNREAAAARR